jgi:hypothetical protein
MTSDFLSPDDENPMATGLSSGIDTPYNFDSSIPPTPGEGIHFTPKRAMKSFDNLVALANYQERLKDARKVVWRDRGESVAELETLRECLEHAARGGFRAYSIFHSESICTLLATDIGSASLAFGIRASVNLVLAFIRIHRVPR